MIYCGVFLVSVTAGGAAVLLLASESYLSLLLQDAALLMFERIALALKSVNQFLQFSISSGVVEKTLRSLASLIKEDSYVDEEEGDYFLQDFEEGQKKNLKSLLSTDLDFSASDLQASISKHPFSIF